MKKYIVSTLALFILSVSWTNAQTPPANLGNVAPDQTAVNQAVAVTVATVNIYQAKIVSQNDRTFTLTFDLSNRVGVQSGIKYGVTLMDDKGKTVDWRAYDEVVNLGENQRIPKTISYVVPEFIMGRYKIFINVFNGSGTILNAAYAGEIIMNGKISYAQILSETCYLTVDGRKDGKRFKAPEAPSISVGETLKATCQVNNISSETVSAHPQFETRKGTPFGEIARTVQDIDLETAVVSLKKGQASYSFSLPRAEAAGTYNVKMNLAGTAGEGKEFVSNSVRFNYAVQGDDATIRNVVLDKSSYLANETARVQLFWTGSGTTTAGVVITDADGSACGSVNNQILQAGKAVVNITVPILEDCGKPSISLTLSDSGLGENKVLDAVSLKAPVMEDSQDLGTSQSKYAYLAILLVIISVIILMIAHVMHRNARALSIFAFVMISGYIFIFPVDSAFAASETQTEPFMGSTLIYTMGLNDNTYYPGDPIYVTGSVKCDVVNPYSLFESPCPSTLYITMVGLDNYSAPISLYSEALVFASGFIGGGVPSLYIDRSPMTFTAPAYDGNTHYIYAVGAYPGMISGWNAIFKIPFNVVPPTPVALNVTVLGDGSGTVAQSGTNKGINCAKDFDGNYFGTCNTAPAKDSNVTLMPVPNYPANATPPSFFVEWRGDVPASCNDPVSAGYPNCTVNMNSSKKIQAYFNKAERKCTADPVSVDIAAPGQHAITVTGETTYPGETIYVNEDGSLKWYENSHTFKYTSASTQPNNEVRYNWKVNTGGVQYGGSCYAFVEDSSIQPITTSCSGVPGPLGSATFTANSTTGGNGSYSYRWNVKVNGVERGWSDWFKNDNDFTDGQMHPPESRLTADLEVKDTRNTEVAGASCYLDKDAPGGGGGGNPVIVTYPPITASCTINNGHMVLTSETESTPVTFRVSNIRGGTGTYSKFDYINVIDGLNKGNPFTTNYAANSPLQATHVYASITDSMGNISEANTIYCGVVVFPKLELYIGPGNTYPTATGDSIKIKKGRTFGLNWFNNLPAVDQRTGEGFTCFAVADNAAYAYRQSAGWNWEGRGGQQGQDVSSTGALSNAWTTSNVETGRYVFSIECNRSGEGKNYNDSATLQVYTSVETEI